MKNRGESVLFPDRQVPLHSVDPDRNVPAQSPLLLQNEQHPSLGSFAYTILHKQVHAILKQRSGVLAQRDPEPLHQMRVALRRLRTGLQIFGFVITLPKSLQENRTRQFAKQLGELRDLDVQVQILEDHYRPQLDAQERRHLERVHQAMGKQHHKTAKRVKALLKGETFSQWKANWKIWFDQPIYRGCHQLSILSALPDLLCPMVSEFLLHPAWQIITLSPSAEESVQLHDFRKVCKHMRYRAEFFAPFYGPSFQTWIKELKQFQDCLGQIQDAEVLANLLAGYTTVSTQLPKLATCIGCDRKTALEQWLELRQNYLSQEQRYGLYQLILSPTPTSSTSGRSQQFQLP